MEGIRRKTFYLAFKKRRGNFIPINFNNIPIQDGYIDGDATEVDRFTSMFEDEKSLKTFLTKYADYIGLEEAIIRDDLALVTEDIIREMLKGVVSSIGLRTTLTKDATEIALSNTNKKLLKAIYDESYYDTKESELIKTLKGLIVNKIKNNEKISSMMQEDLLNVLEELELTAEQRAILINFIESYKPKYELEKDFEICVVCRQKKKNSPKYSNNSLPNGVVYAKDTMFMNIGFLKRIFREAVNQPEIDFLEKIFAKANPLTQSENIFYVRDYFKLLKANSAENKHLDYALQAVNMFVDFEVFVYNAQTGKVVQTPQNTYKINYLGLRRLALLVSQIYHAKYELDIPSLDQRLAEIDNAKHDYTYTLKLFDKPKR